MNDLKITWSTYYTGILFLIHIEILITEFDHLDHHVRRCNVNATAARAHSAAHNCVCFRDGL